MKKIFWALLLVLCLFAVVAPVFAQDGNETETEPIIANDAEPTVIEQFLSKIGIVLPASFVIAFVTCMLGYLRTTPPDNFDITKFLGTLIFAILLGMVTTLAGWDYATGEAWLGQAGITIWVYWLAKIVAIKMGWTSETEKIAKS